MAHGVAERTWRTTTPDQIEHELSTVWRSVAASGRVSRAVMANLIVYRELTRARTADFRSLVGDIPIDEVAAQHPSRVIVVSHERLQDDEAPFTAGVGVATFGPPQARFAVEQIAVQSACTERSLPSIVRRLLKGGLPTSVWWAEDLSRVAPIDPIVSMGRQFLYDSRRCRDVKKAMLALAPLVSGEPRIAVADINWRRLAPVRRALLDAAAQLNRRELPSTPMKIVARPGDGALAWLAAGWLASRLGLSPDAAIAVGEQRNGDDILTMMLGAGATELSLTLSPHRVTVKHHSGRIPPFAIGVPREDEADAVAAELRSLTHDACLRDAVRTLIGRFSAS